MGVVFCQVEVSVTDRSFVQRSPTKCVCVWCVWCVCVCGVCGVCVWCVFVWCVCVWCVCGVCVCVCVVCVYVCVGGVWCVCGVCGVCVCGVVCVCVCVWCVCVCVFVRSNNPIHLQTVGRMGKSWTLPFSRCLT